MSLQTLFTRLSGEYFKPAWNRYRNANVREYLGLVYDENQPGICRLDIFRKTLRGKLPVLVYLHGGLAASLGRQHRKGFCRYAAGKGAAVISLDYGRGRAHPFPSQMKQVLAALDWTDKQALQYGLDTSNIIIGGDGEGAFIAAAVCCALTDKSYAEALGIDTKGRKVAGAVFFCGMYDIPYALSKNTKYSKYNTLRNTLSALLGIDTAKDGDFQRYPYKSVLNTVDKISAVFPPTFFSHTSADTVFTGQDELLKKRLADLGVPYWEFCSAESASPHIWNMSANEKEAAACNDALGDFIKAVCDGRIFIARYEI